MGLISPNFFSVLGLGPVKLKKFQHESKKRETKKNREGAPQKNKKKKKENKEGGKHTGGRV